MKHRVIILMLIVALFKLGSAWANPKTADDVLLKNKSEPLLYDLLGHLEYQPNKGFVEDETMASSLEQLVKNYALDGSHGYAYVVNVDSGKVTWSTLPQTRQAQKELKAHKIDNELYIQSNAKNYFLAKSFWVKALNNTKENFQIVLTINY